VPGLDKIRAGTVTASIQFENANGKDKFGILTSGHVVGPLEGSFLDGCEAPEPFNMIVGRWSDVHYWNGEADMWDADPNVNFWNGDGEINNGGRNAWWIHNDSTLPSFPIWDAAVIRIGNADPRPKVHLGPFNGYEEPDWLVHKTKFDQLLPTGPDNNVTVCVAKGRDEGVQGLTCGLSLGHFGRGLWEVNLEPAEAAVSGDSGAPVFNTSSKPDLWGLLVATDSGSGDFLFAMADDMFTQLEASHEELNDIKLCSGTPFGGQEVSC